MERAEELIAQLEFEIVRRDETIARLQSMVNRALDIGYLQRNPAATVVSAEPDHSAQHLNMVSAQPAGEVPEAVAWLSNTYVHGRTVQRASLSETSLAGLRHGTEDSAAKILSDVPLMTVDQHTRIVAALQARAVVMPDRIRCDNYTKVDIGSKNFKAGFNFALDEVARLNGKQVDPLEWSRKHGIEEY
jgi:hypothetical protein